MEGFKSEVANFLWKEPYIKIVRFCRSSALCQKDSTPGLEENIKMLPVIVSRWYNVVVSNFLLRF